MNIFIKTLNRDLKMALRNPSSFLNPLLFFVISISLFPIAISPESQTLSNIAPGIIWVTVMLSALLSLNTLFHFDYENGILEISNQSITFKGPRNTFDKKGFFISPKTLSKERLNNTKDYEKSLKQSVNYFIKISGNNRLFDLNKNRLSLISNMLLLKGKN